MQIVIDIPDDIYSVIVKQYRKDKELQTRDNLYKAIANGTPLPKGHGRLIDANAAKCSTCSSFGCENWYLCKSVKAETIVEVDGGDAK